MLLHEILQAQSVHVENRQVVFTVRLRILRHDVLDRLQQMLNGFLIYGNLVSVALLLGQHHPAEFLKDGVIPLMQAVERGGVHRNAMYAVHTTMFTCLAHGIHFVHIFTK